jgi:hypothetical protein
MRRACRIPILPLLGQLAANAHPPEQDDEGQRHAQEPVVGPAHGRPGLSRLGGHHVMIAGVDHRVMILKRGVP